MPIRIADHSQEGGDPRGREVAWLCDQSWRLPDQLSEFEAWLQKNGDLPKGKYSADVGFAPRPDAMGGGGGLSIDSIQILSKIGMEVWFSEYPLGPLFKPGSET